MEFREAVVRVETADLLTAHAYYGDAGEVAYMIGLHAPDSIYELPSEVEGHGAGEVDRLLGGASSGSSADGWGFKYVRHHLTTSRVEFLSETEASLDFYCVNRE